MKSNSTLSSQKTIAVLGSSRSEKKSKEYKQAFELGFLLAKSGFCIINGGGPGSMEATALGAKKGGGTVIAAIVPGAVWARPNSFSETIIECEDVFLRIRMIYQRARAFIFLKGGTGTLAELAIIWNLLSLENTPTRPIFLLGDSWDETMFAIRQNMMITPDEERVIKIVREPLKIMQELNQEVGIPRLNPAEIGLRQDWESK